jgi:hypothetical protein
MTTRKHVCAVVIGICVLITGAAVIAAQSSATSSTPDQTPSGTIRIEPLDGRQLRVRIENSETAVIDAGGFVLTWTDQGVVKIVADREVTIKSSKGEIRAEGLQVEIGPGGFRSASVTVTGQKR